MADDATDLSALLGNAPVQQFAPMVTGGGDPFIAPVTAPKPTAATMQNNVHMFNTIRYSIRSLSLYLAFAIAAAVVSLSTPRTLILQYIPNTYTSGGVVSYTGAAVLGLAATVLAYVIGTLFHSIL